MQHSYIPSPGDIMFLDFHPSLGHEQSGRRPALVVSSRTYNQTFKMAVFCPITTKTKGYPFEVQLLPNLKTTGVILTDHIKNCDFGVRNMEYIETVNRETLNAVTEKLAALLEIP